jgi:hypothetical protein
MEENAQAAVAETTYLAMRELRRYGYIARLTETDDGSGLIAATTPNGTALNIHITIPE